MNICVTLNVDMLRITDVSGWYNVLGVINGLIIITGIRKGIRQ